MRMLDNDSDKTLNDVLILLTRKEAIWLRDEVAEMLSDVEQGHYHVIDLDNPMRQFTLGLYDDVDIEKNTYIPRVIDLIREDK